MSTKKVYRSAIVGCGGRSVQHAKAYKLISRGELVACCDLDTERRQSYAKEFDIKPYAERGRTLYEEFGRWEIVFSERVEGGKINDASEWEEGNHAAQAGLTNAMFDWLENDSRPVGTNLKLSLHQWNVVLGLYASSLLRRPIDIPFDPPGDLFLRLADVLR